MQILNVTDKRFCKYGRIIREVDFTELILEMKKVSIPASVVYEPSVAQLETLTVSGEVQRRLFGELPIQVGYCIGHNKSLNAVEYHRSSEINVAATNMVLMLGLESDIADGYSYDTSKMELFSVPEGCAVELYATTLHYAPCNADEHGFLVAVVLPKGTNYPLENQHQNGEDALLTAKNKWLIGHPDAGLPEGTHLGLIGENLTL